MPEGGRGAEMRYFCPDCEEPVAEATCPRCHGPADPLEDAAEAAPPAPPGTEPPRDPTGEEAGRPGAGNVVRLAPSPAREQAADIAAPPEPVRRPTPEADRPTAPSRDRPGVSEVRAEPLPAKEGQRTLEQYTNEGYEVFLIAGIKGVGKTELLRAYRQDGFLSSFEVKGGRVMPTSPGQLKCYPVSVGGRKVVFVDAAGEDFRLLYPEMRRARAIAPEDVEFLRLVSRNLSGLVLLVDLQQLWKGGEADQRQQQEILAWVLALLRWLRFDGEYEAGSAIRFQEHVDRRVKVLRRRLRVPVQVLFSKADELVGLALPGDAEGSYWRRRSGRPERNLQPAGESAFFLAYHHLPELYAALEEHAAHFRFDFAHSLVLDPDAGTVEDPQACGVAYSVGWLLDPEWRWPAAPTRWWVGLQRALDRSTGRGARWRRLLDPRELRP